MTANIVLDDALYPQAMATAEKLLQPKCQKVTPINCKEIIYQRVFKLGKH